MTTTVTTSGRDRGQGSWQLFANPRRVDSGSVDVCAGSTERCGGGARWISPSQTRAAFYVKGPSPRRCHHRPTAAVAQKRQVNLTTDVKLALLIGMRGHAGANQVREHRRLAGFTQAQVAALVGVSRQSVVSIERGDYAPSVYLALRLARALDSSVEVLFPLAEESE